MPHVGRRPHLDMAPPGHQVHQQADRYRLRLAPFASAHSIVVASAHRRARAVAKAAARSWPEPLNRAALPSRCNSTAPPILIFSYHKSGTTLRGRVMHKLAEQLGLAMLVQYGMAYDIDPDTRVSPGWSARWDARPLQRKMLSAWTTRRLRQIHTSTHERYRSSATRCRRP